MTTVDLFDQALSGTVAPAAEPHARRRPASTATGPADRHFRLAMRAARRLPRSDRRDDTTRLICHHLRRMLEEEPLGRQTAGGPRAG